MNYLLVVQASCAKVSDHVFATESAFGEHLRVLKRKLEPRFDRLIVAAPTMSDEQYRGMSNVLAHIDERSDGISFLPLHPVDVSVPAFWAKHARRIWKDLRATAQDAAIVHSGLSDDVYRPVMAMADAVGAIEGRDVIFVVDIDGRRDSWRFWKTGVWSLRSYLFNRVFHDQLKLLQVKLAPRYCSLVLLKSASMVRDIGHGASHVRNFFDTAHAPEHVIDADAMQPKLTRLRSGTEPLKLVFFGRFVEYKGLSRAIEAVWQARRASGRSIELHLLGSGEEKPKLERLVADLGASRAIFFHDPVPYGKALFDRIREFDVTIATPLVEDTPRAAFDALASALPIVAFDIQYYRDLAEASQAVSVTPWPEVQPLAERIVELDRDREALVRQAECGVRFAKDNTQDAWLDRRVAWTFELLDRRAAVEQSQ